jgi:UDP-2-acetamido-3-amino-2,3-dideoxy-glucuronate N-acetyltransferase
MLFRDPLRWTQGQTPVPNHGNGEPVAVPESEPLRNECAHFLACCRERRTPRTDGREGLRVLRVLRAAQASLERSGERVDPTDAAGPAPYYVHSTAIVDAGATIGAGTKIWHFAHVSAGSQIGKKCIFGQNTFVAPGVTIGDNVKVQNNVAIYTGTVIEEDVFLGPSCVLTNVTNPRSQVNRHDLYERTVIRRGATIGANATIVCGITLGRYCFVAAGALVAKDVPDYALMQGVPARQVGWMSRHGHRLTPDAAGVLMCPESGYRYEEISPGQLRCVDLREEEALPQSLRQGMKTYDELKATSVEMASDR